MPASAAGFSGSPVTSTLALIMKALLLIAIACLLSACAADRSSTSVYHFAGIVTDWRDTPISHAKVEAMSFNAHDYGVTVYGTALTDTSGHFDLLATEIPESLQIYLGNLYGVILSPQPDTEIKVILRKRKS